jgi:hypothetical protein
MYTQTKDINISLYSVTYPDQANLPLFINNRNPDGISYSLAYPTNINLFISINTLDNPNVNGILYVFRDLTDLTVINPTPDYIINIVNSEILNSDNGIYTLSFGFSGTEQVFVGFQFIPSTRNTFQGALNIHSNILYSFTPTLPPGGFVVKEVDSISGVEIPLMLFFP